MTFRPKTEALAFRIWQVAERRGWDLTLKEVADEIGANWQSVLNIVRWKGWLNRFRTDVSTSRRRRFPLDVPLYDPVWHTTHSQERHRTVDVLRRFSTAEWG